MNLQPNLARWCGQRFVFIEHHLGLGDHLICNGLYRQVARKHTLCFLVVSLDLDDLLWCAGLGLSRSV